jgi:hypothetical protein
MSTHAHLRFWLAIIAATFFLTPLWRTGEAMDMYVAQEVRLTRETFGEGVTDEVSKRASFVYKFLPDNSVAAARIEGDGMRRTQLIVPGPGVALATSYNKYIEGLIQLSYIAIIRCLILAVWLFVLAPIFIAAVIDGFVQRAIKRSEFGAIRPAAYTLTSIIVVPLAMAPILYLVVPISISPLITPMWALITALPLALMVSNMQPIFGKN